MPRAVDEGCKDFLDRLTPTATESAGASSHRASIKACLEGNFGLKRFVRIGSFGNGTSISGYSDVDYLASIPTGHLTVSSDYSLRKVRNALDTRAYKARGAARNSNVIEAFENWRLLYNYEFPTYYC